jgi:hypothetical protein
VSGRRGWPWMAMTTRLSDDPYMSKMLPEWTEEDDQGFLV